jgi:hypothetical protein
MLLFSGMDAWLVILAIARIGVVIGRLLYELNPAAWKNAAERVEDDTPPDGAIDDYLDWVNGWDELDLTAVRRLDSTVSILANDH